MTKLQINRRELIRAALWTTAAATLPTPLIRSAFSAGASVDNRVLRVVKRTIEVKGRPASVYGLIQPNGTPGLSLPAGGLFDVALRNEAPEPTIIHWHGLTPPWGQDGVPNAPHPLLGAQEERQFRFPVGAAGTHWMHAHTLQEQSLLAAPLIVFDLAEQARDEQDVVVLLHDFSFSTPEELLARLKGGAAHGSMAGMDHSGMGHGAPTPQPGHSPAAVGMDLNDIEYDAYLANDRTLDDPEAVKVETGGRIRLRIINGATATAFTIDLGELDGTLIAVDGQDTVPVKGRRFPITMGQRLDIRLALPRSNDAFPILALREGARERTGIVLVPAKAPIRKLASDGRDAGPVVDLALEQTLRAAKPLISRQPDKRFDMALVGSMQGYAWGLKTNREMVMRKNDRVEVTMTNPSMMAHPMHLHGHHFQVVAIDGRRFTGAVRDTVHIPPQRSVTIAFDAGNPGQWAFHCHHLYHMAAGMMTNVSYEG
jgi:FtsP/CotA-like multicopper oxidase with cupredoxin domain